MTWPQIAIYLVVLCIGLPAAYRNATAAALCATWGVGEVVWHLTGDNLPLKVYFMGDMAVLTVILAKATVHEGCRIYPTVREQLRCFWRVLSVPDRLIAISYPLLVWPTYVIEMHAFYRWWVLYGVLVAQFVLAASEAVLSLLGKKNQGRCVKRPPGGPGLAFARGLEGHA